MVWGTYYNHYIIANAATVDANVKIASQIVCTCVCVCMHNIVYSCRLMFALSISVRILSLSRFLSLSLFLYCGKILKTNAQTRNSKVDGTMTRSWLRLFYSTPRIQSQIQTTLQNVTSSVSSVFRWFHILYFPVPSLLVAKLWTTIIWGLNDGNVVGGEKKCHVCKYK